jgi:hypothetical protein
LLVVLPVSLTFAHAATVSLYSCHVQVRCLVDVPGPKLPSDLPGYLRATVAPQVPPELQQAFLTAIDNEAIRSMQNKQVSCQPMHQPGEACRVYAAV